MRDKNCSRQSNRSTKSENISKRVLYDPSFSEQLNREIEGKKKNKELERMNREAEAKNMQYKL